MPPCSRDPTRGATSLHSTYLRLLETTMAKVYRAAVIGTSRMGAFIDNEVPPERRPYSHAAGYEACARTDLVACSDLREDVMAKVGERYSVPEHRRYVDYHELLERERLTADWLQLDVEGGVLCHGR